MIAATYNSMADGDRARSTMPYYPYYVRIHDHDPDSTASSSSASACCCWDPSPGPSTSTSCPPPQVFPRPPLSLSIVRPLALAPRVFRPRRLAPERRVGLRR